MGRPWSVGNSRDKILGWRGGGAGGQSRPPPRCLDDEIVTWSLFLLSFLVHASYSTAAELVKRWMFFINRAREWDASKRDVKARRSEISGASSTFCSKTKRLNVQRVHRRSASERTFCARAE